MAAEDQTWEALEKSITDKKCVLVMGPDLAAPVAGKSMMECMKDYLVAQSPDESPIRFFYSDDEFFLFDQNQEQGLINMKIREFYEELPTPAVYHRIAEIPFHLVISVSPDHLLKNVMGEYKLDFDFQFYDKEQNPAPVEKPTDQKPLVYNLFGDIDVESSMVFTYDDLFEYLMKIFGEFKLPEKLQLELNNCTTVLFMGFSIEKWYFRLLLRLLRLNKSGLKRTAKKHESQIPGIRNFYYDEFKMRFIDAGEEDIISKLHEKFREKKELRLSRKDAPLTQQGIYISYAWKDDNNPEREAIVDELYSALKEKGYNIIRDKNDLGYKGNISSFMELIGKGAYVIVVISDKYLRSKNCMFEMYEIMKNSDQDISKRIFPVVLPDARIYDETQLLNYYGYWEEKDRLLQEEIKKHDLGYTEEVIKALNLYKDIRRIIGYVIHLVGNFNTLTPEMHRANKFADIKTAIDAQMQEDKLKTNAHA
jgi:hypothetical protein